MSPGSAARPASAVGSGNCCGAICEQVRQGMATRGIITWADVFGQLAEGFAQGAAHPFTHAVVDEAQDVGVAELRLLAAVAAGGSADALFFTGDLGQRIFQQPFSWKSLGVDVRGRSHTLSINYRTSQQIRTWPTGSCPRPSPTWMVTVRAGAAQCPC